MSTETLKELLPLALIILLLVCAIPIAISNHRFQKNVIDPSDREFFRKRAEYRKNKTAYEERFECKYPRESMGRTMCSRECEHFDRIWINRCELKGGNR